MFRIEAHRGHMPAQTVMEPHGLIRSLQEERLYRRRSCDPSPNQWVPEKVAIPANGLRQKDEPIASDRDALSEHITRQRGVIYAMIDNITTNLYSIYDSLKATNARMWDFLGPSALPGGGFAMPFPTTQEEITSMCCKSPSTPTRIFFAVTETLPRRGNCLVSTAAGGGAVAQAIYD